MISLKITLQEMELAQAAYNPSSVVHYSALGHAMMYK
jgi:hypothetical protein